MDAIEVTSWMRHENQISFQSWNLFFADTWHLSPQFQADDTRYTVNLIAKCEEKMFGFKGFQLGPSIC